MRSNWSAHDEAWMQRALELAAKGGGYTNPNPLVGAVAVKDGQAVGEGFTQPYGGHHAERLALQMAGDEAKNATLYVNWEPCIAYLGKQTPPCADLIIESGINRVVIAARDPHPHINGNGIARLREAGIAVDVGLLEAQSLHLNEVSFVYHTQQRPFVCLKWAMTLDGKIATRSGDSQWISGEASRTRTHELRHRYAAILVGVNTVLQDDPALTVRRISGKDPWRIVLDSTGRMPLDAKLLQLESDAPTIVATTDAMPQSVEKTLKQRGATVWRLPAMDDRVDLKALLERMKRERLDSLLVEGGSEVHWSFLSQRLANKLVCFIGSKLVGGHQAPSPVGGRGVVGMADAFHLDKISVEHLDQDVIVTSYPCQ